MDALDEKSSLLPLARKQIKSGSGEKAASILERISPDLLHQNDLSEYVCLSAVLASTGYGSNIRTREANAIIPPDANSFIRYRAALASDDWRTAKRLRQYAEKNLKNGHDSVRWAASLVCLHKGRKQMGFKFYHHRLTADHGVKSWPRNALHIPFSGKIETKSIHLEQGVGDILLHLAHIKSTGLAQDLTFHCTKRWKSFIDNHFPTCTAKVHEDWVTVPDGTALHASADFLANQYLATRTIRPVVRIAELTDQRSGYGISWRGGAQSLNDSDRRTLDLTEMLRALPSGPKFYCLQYDITREELSIIKQLRPDILFPKTNMKSDIYGLFNLIRGLKGVISVRNTTLHMAGNAGIDALGFIDKTTSWLWSDDGSTPRHI